MGNKICSRRYNKLWSQALNSGFNSSSSFFLKLISVWDKTYVCNLVMIYQSCHIAGLSLLIVFQDFHVDVYGNIGYCCP